MQENGNDEEIKRRRKERRERAILISTFAILAAGILTFAATDAFFRPRGPISQRTACIKNLRAMDGAKAIWRLEKNKDTNAIPADADLFGPALYLREKPTCPAGGAYTFGGIGMKPRCSVLGHTI